MDHPYPIGALIAALTFLLSFRANFSYNRFWEAMTSVYQMHSKWLDVGMELAAFHLQSSAYDGKKPPAFGAHPQLTSIERARERLNETTLEELQHMLEETATPNNDQSLRTRVNSFIKKKTPQDITSKINNSAVVKSINRRHTKPQALKKKTNFFTRLYGGSNPKETDMKCTTNYQTSKIWEEDKPPLFLQEGAHLLSLLSAVACSTLRNDLEQADSPLITFVPNEPWPAVDPDDIDADTRKDWTRTDFQSCSNLKYLVGHTRTPAARTLYNAARPFRVVGGVSDAEIELLQAARGPLAKVALVSMWLQEFISREYLHGSTGKVAPPILSRLYQYVSDGMLGYNQARKVAYIPFPFPHAQITSLFVLVVVGFMPILMITFIDGEAFGLILNLLTVMCFTGTLSKTCNEPLLHMYYH